jgi:hypothetical protein
MGASDLNHVRRLAEITIQPNVGQELRRVAEEFDRVVDDPAAHEPEFHRPEIWSGSGLGTNTF